MGLCHGVSSRIFGLGNVLFSSVEWILMRWWLTRGAVKDNTFSIIHLDVNKQFDLMQDFGKIPYDLKKIAILFKNRVSWLCDLIHYTRH